MADIQLFVYSVYIPTPIGDSFLTDRMRSSQAPNTRAWFAILLLLFFPLYASIYGGSLQLGCHDGNTSVLLLCVVSMFCFSKMKRSWITQMVICTSVVELLAYVYYKMRSQKPKKKVLLPKGKISSHLLPSSSFLMKHRLLQRLRLIVYIVGLKIPSAPHPIFFLGSGQNV